MPLYEMEPLSRFSDRAQAYAHHRPSYPAAAIAAILAEEGTSPPLIAADIGAGTGIASRLLAEAGVQVWAIEPNEAMRHAAISHPQIQWLAGTAEATGLAPAGVDLVTCFQSFHWFNPAQCLPEFRRILKPTGRLAVVWNDRDRADPLTQGYSQIVQRLSNHHPAEQRMVAEQPLFGSPDFGSVRSLQFPYRQSLTLGGLIGRAQSVSYIPTDARSQAQLRDELTALHEQWADSEGQVHLAYTTRVFLAEPR